MGIFLMVLRLYFPLGLPNGACDSAYLISYLIEQGFNFFFQAGGGPGCPRNDPHCPYDLQRAFSGTEEAGMIPK